VWGRTLTRSERKDEIFRFRERFGPIRSSFPNIDLMEEELASQSDFKKELDRRCKYTEFVDRRMRIDEEKKDRTSRYHYGITKRSGSTDRRR